MFSQQLATICYLSHLVACKLWIVSGRWEGMLKAFAYQISYGQKLPLKQWSAVLLAILPKQSIYLKTTILPPAPVMSYFALTSNELRALWPDKSWAVLPDKLRAIVPYWTRYERLTRYDRLTSYERFCTYSLELRRQMSYEQFCPIQMSCEQFCPIQMSYERFCPIPIYVWMEYMSMYES